MQQIMQSILCSAHAETALALEAALGPAAEMPKQVIGIHNLVFF